MKGDENDKPEAAGSGKIIRLDEAQLRDHLDRKISESVEETLNKQLTLVSYVFDDETITLVAIGSHENSYRDLKNDLKD